MDINPNCSKDKIVTQEKERKETREISVEKKQF